MSTNILEPDRPQTIKWRMRFACWLPKATNKHSDLEYLLLFHCNIGCINTRQRYIIRTLPVLFRIAVGDILWTMNTCSFRVCLIRQICFRRDSRQMYFFLMFVIPKWFNTYINIQWCVKYNKINTINKLYVSQTQQNKYNQILLCLTDTSLYIYRRM